MGKVSRVALDSNCYTYLIETLNSGKAPAQDDPLRAEKLALVRIMLYDEWGLYIAPTVIREYLRIPDIARVSLHKEWDTLFTEVQPINPTGVDERTNQLSAYHADEDDCRMLAEAEDAGIKTVVTYDRNLISRLGGKTTVRVTSPTDYWTGLSISRGAKPQTLPHATNPLVSASWWRW